MNKILSSLMFAAYLGSLPTAVLADPPVSQFYMEAQKITPTGKLGEVVKKEKIKTSSLFYKSINMILPMLIILALAFIMNWIRTRKYARKR